MCQPMVMMLVAPLWAELTSTIGPGSRKRRTLATGKSVLVYFGMISQALLRSPDAAQRHQRVYARLRRAMAVRSRAGVHMFLGGARLSGAAQQALHRVRDKRTHTSLRSA